MVDAIRIFFRLRGVKNGGYIMEQRKIIGKILQVVVAIILGFVAYWVLIVLTGGTTL